MMLKKSEAGRHGFTKRNGFMVWGYTSQVLFLLGEVGVQSAGVYLQEPVVVSSKLSSNDKTCFCLAQSNGFCFGRMTIGM
jgi:hypothetical protein